MSLLDAVIAAKLSGGSGGGGGSGTDSNAVHYTAETKTDAEKSQARANIGATDALTSIPDDVKAALLNCFSHVAWDDEHGQDYYDELSAALYLGPLEGISAVFEQGANVIYDTDSLDVLRQYLTVTADYTVAGEVEVTGYTLSGTLEVGTSTITVSYGGKTDTFSVTVSTHLLYSMENTSFNAQSFNTNVALLETDHDWSVAVDVTLTTSPTSGNASVYRLMQVAKSDMSAFLLSFGKPNANSEGFVLSYMGNYDTGGITSVAGTGRHRFVATHTKSSGNVDLKYRKDTSSAVSVSQNGTFVSSSKTLCIGYGSTNYALPTGTINKAYVYDNVMSSSEIDAFLGL